jgi:hypothetical protein
VILPPLVFPGEWNSPIGYRIAQRAKASRASVCFGDIFVIGVAVNCTNVNAPLNVAKAKTLERHDIKHNDTQHNDI